MLFDYVAIFYITTIINRPLNKLIYLSFSIFLPRYLFSELRISRIVSSHSF